MTENSNGVKIAFIQITPWDRPYIVDLGGFVVKEGDFLVVNTEFGIDIGRVTSLGELADDKVKLEENILTVDRLATDEDNRNFKDNQKNKQEVLHYCHTVIKRHNLDMKLVDCHFSLDDKKITLAFIADGRIDFRALVKELTRHFQKNVRLHQLGVRDEAKLVGDVGCCGRQICCQGALTELVSVTSEYAEDQQVAHRGSERLSGICGRLKCCLAYEKDLYQELAAKLPAVGTRVRTDHGRGEVIGRHILKSSVNVRLDPEKAGERPVTIEVPIKK